MNYSTDTYSYHILYHISYQYILYIIYYILYIIYYILYIIYYILYIHINIYYILYIIYTYQYIIFKWIYIIDELVEPADPGGAAMKQGYVVGTDEWIKRWIGRAITND